MDSRHLRTAQRRRNWVLAASISLLFLVAQNSVGFVVERDSSTCPGARENARFDDDTNEFQRVISIFVPSGATATCVAPLPNGVPGVGLTGTDSTLINKVPGLVVETTGGTGNTIVNDADGFVVLMEGDSHTIENNGTSTSSGENSGALLIIGDDATVTNTKAVESSGEGSVAIGIDGDMGEVENSGTVKANGNESVAIGLEGDDGKIANSGTAEIVGDEATALFIEGNDATISITETGKVKAKGAEASAVGIEGDVATVVNDGEVTVSGALSAGLTAEGNEATVINNNKIMTSDGSLTAMGVFGHDATLINSGTIETSGANATGIAALGGKGDKNQGEMVTNDTGGTINTTRQGAHAIALGLETLQEIVGAAALPPGATAPAEGEVTNKGEITTSGMDADGIHAFASKAKLTNLGTINVTGPGGSGINAMGDDAAGDELRIQNGKVQAMSVPDSARIVVSAANGVGIRTSSENNFVGNSSVINVDGSNVTGIEVKVTGNGQLWTNNDGKISVKGSNGIGIHVLSDSPDVLRRIGTSTNSNANCVGGGSAGGRVINCGEINLGETNIATAMLIDAIASTSIENQGKIFGTGRAQKGIVVNPAGNGNSLVLQNNVVENLGDITLNGVGAEGVVINSDGNFFLNGTGVSDFSLLPGPGPKPVISTFLDRIEFRDIGTGSPFSTQQIGAQGKINVEGVNARGLVLNGDGNLVGNQLSGVASFDGTVSTSSESFSEIIAKGAGAIAVEIAGARNVINNVGLIQGDLFAIRGGDGVDTVINLATINGDIALGAGNDSFIFMPGADFNGVSDGGLGMDDLTVVFPADFEPDLTDTSPVFIGSMDGDKFQRFENFTVDLNEPAVPGIKLQNTLVVDKTIIREGDLILDGARLEAEQITIEAGGRLKGTGTITALPNDIGMLNFSRITVEEGGGVLGGNSPGSLTFIGDVFFAGLLEIEFAGSEDGLFDTLFVDGDLDFDQALISFVFLDDFIPDLGDLPSFLTVTGDVTGFDSVNFLFSGLASGFGFDVSLDPLLGGGFGVNLTTVAVARSVPEPDTLILFVMGLAGLVVLDRRRRYLNRTTRK